MTLNEFLAGNPEINEYIDVAEGIGRIRNNKRVYQLILSEFIKDTHLDIVNDEIVKGNLEEAGKNAHAVKGISANLSMKKAYALSAELEQKLKGGELDTGLLSNVVNTVKKTKELTQILIDNLENIEF